MKQDIVHASRATRSESMSFAGIENISQRDLLILSDALNVNARWLVFGEVGPKKQPFENPHLAQAAAIAHVLSDRMVGLARRLDELEDASELLDVTIGPDTSGLALNQMTRR